MTRFQRGGDVRRGSSTGRDGARETVYGRAAKEEGEKEEEAAARRLFEAWKRALDATIEVPDCEPAINASSLVEREPRSGEGGYGRGAGGANEGERTRVVAVVLAIVRKRGGRGRGRGGERAEGVKSGGKGWLCLAVKAPGGCARGRVPRGIRLEGSRLAYRALASRILILRTEPGEDRLATNLPMFVKKKEKKKRKKKRREGNEGTREGVEGTKSRVSTLLPTSVLLPCGKRYSERCQ